MLTKYCIDSESTSTYKSATCISVRAGQFHWYISIILDLTDERPESVDMFFPPSHTGVSMRFSTRSRQVRGISSGPLLPTFPSENRTKNRLNDKHVVEQRAAVRPNASAAAAFFFDATRFHFDWSVSTDLRVHIAVDNGAVLGQELG